MFKHLKWKRNRGSGRLSAAGLDTEFEILQDIHHEFQVTVSTQDYSPAIRTVEDRTFTTEDGAKSACEKLHQHLLTKHEKKITKWKTQ